MKNRFGETKVNFKTTIALAAFALVLLTLATIPVASANDVAIDLSPTQGPPGTSASVYGIGFVTGEVTVSFNSKDVTRTHTGMFGRISTGFIIPNLSPGTYPVTAEDTYGNRATKMFTVTQKGSSSNPSTSNPSGTLTQTTASITLSSSMGTSGTSVSITGSGFNPGVTVSINFGATYVAGTTADSSGNIASTFTVPSVNAGIYSLSASDARGKYAASYFTVVAPGSSIGGQYFGQPETAGASSSTLLMIATVVVVVCAAIIGTTIFILRRRGKQEALTEQEQPIYQPKPPIQPQSKRYTTPQYGQPRSQQYQYTRYNQPASYGLAPRRNTVSAPYSPQRRFSQAPPSMKTCPNCRQPVKADYSICPSCRKRLK